ncbi:MAG: transcription termination/antitermination protein NusG [Candidatus Sumerlaeia bacterium]|nr:transcription termination/antitermination protein NusG [Candidatus Sumerlaeia bacterium]
MKWYALHTYSGQENTIKKDIEHRASIEGLRDALGEILVPEEKTIEVKDGKKKTHSRNFMPGYVFIQMEENNELFKLIEEVKGVASLLGAGNSRTPIPADEIEKIRNRMEDKKDKPRAEIKFSVGDQVKVVEGPFSNFVGTIDHIDHDKEKLRVMVSIFGRNTPVDLDVLQVEGTGS